MTVISLPAPIARRWRPYALSAICVLAALLYGWSFWTWGWGNTYYSAAVKSMSTSVTTFLFGSFDPAGVFTVDKPPMALWPQVFSTWIFGYHGWALLLPQAVEGVAAVFLLHRTVRRWAGDGAGLIAALVLALTPVTVAINRDNNPDTLLVLFLVAAAYALTRALEAGIAPRRATGWLMLAAFLIGCGFTTKMLAAWVCLPAFLLAYLFGTSAPWRRRIGDLAAAGGVLLAGSLWWVALVDLWPGEKPYIGGSTDGTALDLVLGYNGLGRILGGGLGGGFGGGGPGGLPQLPGGGELPDMPGGFPFPGSNGEPPTSYAGSPAPYGDFPMPSGGIGGLFGGPAGPARMFDDAVGDQVSWLLPLALLIILAVAVLAVLARRRGTAIVPAVRGGWLLWSGWLLVNAVVFSFASGIFHSYYTTMLAPAMAALIGAGTVWLARRREGALAGAGAVAVTAAWAWVLISRDPSWNGWLRYAVPAAAVAAIAFLLLVTRRGRPGPAVAAAVLIPSLLAPATWSLAYAFGPPETNPTNPTAGPRGAFGGMPFAAGRDGSGGMPGAGRQDGSNGPPGSGRQDGPGGWMPGFGSGGPMGGGPMGGGSELSAEQRKILDYAVAHSGGARIKLAVNSPAMATAAYIMNSDATVIGMGGFIGSDPAPTAEQLDRWVKAGELRYVLNGSGLERMMAGQGSGASRTTWITSTCKAVPASEYGGTEQQSDTADRSPFGGVQTLYRCGS
ncbi:ArnT family glycosyltransferase [Nonomuraea jabiensis]|uniref:4-amino-4-deoxy-L-arabinose transferase-like glycosyltransferase n=1 Tax=Nonomuraea jabiensis TaxID=882448 RepID=A0A7W9GCR5_9ACTN|nr:glycosyltransferase family 39 protein [Nonomuraea jabiensis]MBB5781387.1 4-amino-4-deoxy-L-arabinose transferase-like glycosyltransferase [Nonomuraea jabiensis]